MYHAEGTHEAIIDLETFHIVQNEMKIRYSKIKKPATKNAVSPFKGKIICDNCGKHYRRKTTPYNCVWVCGTYKTLGKSYCDSKQVPEDILHGVTNEIFSSHNFNDIKAIGVRNGNILIYQFKDGSEIAKTWKAKPNSERWTSEMKEKARWKALEQHKKRRGK